MAGSKKRATKSGSKGPRAFEFKANFPTNKQPYKPAGEGGGSIVLDVAEDQWDGIPGVHKAARGHTLRVMIEVLPDEVLGTKQTDG